MKMDLVHEPAGYMRIVSLSKLSINTMEVNALSVQPPCSRRVCSISSLKGSAYSGNMRSWNNPWVTKTPDALLAAKVRCMRWCAWWIGESSSGIDPGVSRIHCNMSWYLAEISMPLSRSIVRFWMTGRSILVAWLRSRKWPPMVSQAKNLRNGPSAMKFQSVP